MDHALVATEKLQETETALRDILARAAAAGDYASVVQIASWAQTLRELLSKNLSANDKRADVVSMNGGVSAFAQFKARRSPSKKQTTDYPRFFRRGEELIRVAWSRRARSEYQHKTSEAVFKTVAETLAKIGKGRRVFSTDEFLPLRDAQGSEVPAYQAYVCIALLKMTGLIEQHGRQGYSISTPEEFADAVDAIWRKLPSSK